MTDQTPLDCAVTIPCDENYLPFALHLVRQIQFHCPNRRFDIIVASEEALELPDWAIRSGVIFSHAPPEVLRADLPVGRQTRTTYLKLAMPHILGLQYRRILVLDADIFMENGDLDRLLRVPMGGHSLAAARDTLLFLDPAFHAREFKALNLGPLPYLNAGVMLFDTEVFRRERIFERCMAVPSDTPQAMFLHDQSIINVVMHGKFAELAPAWNWQNNVALPFAPRQASMHFRHFIGGKKPWNDAEGVYEARFRESYAAFFRELMPDALSKLGPAPPNQLISLKLLVHNLIRHGKLHRVVAWGLGRFCDEWDVKV